MNEHHFSHSPFIIVSILVNISLQVVRLYEDIAYDMIDPSYLSARNDDSKIEPVNQD